MRRASWCAGYIFWFSCHNTSPRKHENELQIAKISEQFLQSVCWFLKRRSQILETAFFTELLRQRFALILGPSKRQRLRSNAKVLGRHEAAFGLWSKCWGGDWDIVSKTISFGSDELLIFFNHVSMEIYIRNIPIWILCIYDLCIISFPLGCFQAISWWKSRLMGLLYHTLNDQAPTSQTFTGKRLIVWIDVGPM